MGKLSGGLLILAGIAIGAYALWPQHRAGTEITTAQGTKRIGATAMDAHRPALAPDHAAPPAASPGPLPAKPTAPPPAATTAPLVPPPPVAAHRARPPVPAVRIDEAPPRVPVGAAMSAAAPTLDQAGLTREIQRQLKRIGCYKGDASGVWSPAVRRAMQAFTARVNASLPIEQPDPVLLAMVRSQEPGTCGACPPGQKETADGRCLPAGLIANVAANAGKPRASSAKPPEATKAAKVRAWREAPATAAYRPTEGRMSLGRPRPARAATRSRAARERARWRAAQRRQGPGLTGLPSWVPFSWP